MKAGDDAEDCMPATEAFRESGVRGAFFCVENGGGLMSYLSERLLIYEAHVHVLLRL